VPESESGSPAVRLAAPGITLPKVAVPLAAYLPAERAGGYVYTSGQLPFVDGTPLHTGKVGARGRRRGSQGLRADLCANALAAALAENALPSRHRPPRGTSDHQHERST
jgi:enamine deaminase RidA (YjgF/YER057c/UK114 family)